ncbi:hypothetical protein [Streptomyces sp. WAC05950]|uniref:hypothetical protein n=1 Tax=Streptomyces sp. WAC05950 TaxID=2487419 RepID=UPI000F73C487|nr:hypothetical protein [Streptomyces sp. WAC05950]RST17175.1 hypothetical protein EF904_00285 [Streptomyces sp. WAC05950]
MEENGETAGGDSARSTRRSSSFAALSGALIGAMAGLGGSVLGYLGAVGSQNAQAEAKRAEIRRTAYVTLGSNAQAFIAELSEEGVLMIDRKATDKELEKHYDENFQPTQVKLVQSELTAQLVATEEAGAVLDRLIPHRQSLSTLMATAHVLGGTGTDHSKFGDELVKTRENYQKALEEFLEKVKTEAL